MLSDEYKWHLKFTPYEVQKEALRKSYLKEGFGFLMEMGLGKTGVTMNEIVCLFEMNRIDGAIVFAPNNVVPNWKDEKDESEFPGDVYLWPEEIPKDRPNRPFIYGINYEAVITKKGEKFIEKLLSEYDLMLISDESSKIKGHRSKRTLELIRYSYMPRASYYRILTGTAMPQSPADMWAQLQFIHALRMKFFAFKSRYCKTGGYMGKQIIGVLPDKKAEFQSIIDRSCFIAKKKDWLDLPEKISMPPRRIQMVGEQKRVYEEVAEDFYSIISTMQETFEKDRMTYEEMIQRMDDSEEYSGEIEVVADLVITQMMRLQQIESGFVTLEDGTIYDFFPNGGNPKLVELKEVIEETQGKIIVFSHFRYSVAKVHELLLDLGMNPALIVGRPKKKNDILPLVNINDEKKRFNTDNSCMGASVQIKTGGIGVTLLGDRVNHTEFGCYTTVYYENSFSLEDRLQSEDRNHRIGQKNCVSYIDFWASTITKKIIDALQRKIELNEDLFSALYSKKPKNLYHL